MVLQSLKIKKSDDPRRVDLHEPILVAHQPEFLPWTSYISKATMGDVYFIVDSVQFMKEGFQNRNKIRTNNSSKGWQWLTIPVLLAKKKFTNLSEVKINDKIKWRRKHLSAIKYSYEKTPHFNEIYPELEKIYSDFDGELLVEFVVSITKYAFNKFGINIPVYRTSELKKLGYNLEGEKSDLAINMCKIVDAKLFVFGQYGRRYIEKEKFFQNDIKFVFQKFEHPIYSQIHGEFIPQMSFIDLLFNHGKKSISILKNSTIFSNTE